MDSTRALRFIEDVDLAGTPRDLISMGAAEDAGAIFNQSKNQARVVGSGVFSFTQGVDTLVRESISDSALLAQLVANKRASSTTDPIAWFAIYAEVLQNLGWILQDSGWTDYTNQGTAAEVNEKIVEVMAVALGPSPAALAIITSTMHALKAMDGNGPWITLFSRESQRANISRFQVGLVDQKPGADVFVSLLACLIRAESTIAQVLLFKFRNAHATFSVNAQKVSINRAALTDLGPAVRAKVRAYQADYVSSIADI
jgi:hypothetical protein